MQLRGLGRTKLKVSAVGFGGVPIIKLSFKDAMRLLEEVIDAGMNFLDTAASYQDSELKIGRIPKKRRNEYVISTKSMLRTAHEMTSDVEKALQRLRTDHIELYQAHCVSKAAELNQVLGPGGALEALVRAKKEGKIGHIGITGHNREVLHEALRRCSEFETVQFPFNIIEDGKGERALLDIAGKRGVGTIVMKPLAGGVIPEPELSLRWVLEQGVDVVIPGMVSSAEVRQNARVGREPLPLSDEELSRLQDAVQPLGKEFCRRCMYCEPCPEGIRISTVQELGDKVTVPAVADMNRDIYRDLKKNVEDCVECGECEEKCPYNLPIREMIKKKHRLITRSDYPDPGVL